MHLLLNTISLFSKDGASPSLTESQKNKKNRFIFDLLNSGYNCDGLNVILVNALLSNVHMRNRGKCTYQNLLFTFRETPAVISSIGALAPPKASSLLSVERCSMLPLSGVPFAKFANGIA